jgi:hypothetical protein
MLEMHTCHLRNSMLFLRIGIDHRGNEIVAVDMVGLGGSE